MKLKQVVNRDGMACKYTYAVYDDEDLLAIDLIGADVAVKAVHATLVQNKKVKLDGSWQQKRLPDMNVTTVRTVLEQDPLLCRWHVIPEPTENDLSVIVYGWEDVMPATDAFINALGRWTVWPTLPVWAESLYRLGWQSQLLHRLKCEGVDYAFALAAEGWDEVIDRGVKEGTLLIPDDVPLHA